MNRRTPATGSRASHSNNAYRAILTCSLTAACLLGAPRGWADPELKGTSSELASLLTNVPQVVQVTGESEIKVEADRAILTLKVTTSAKELGAALRANQQVRNRFTSRLAAEGIAPEQVKASRFSSTEKYAVFSDKVRSHRVEHLLKVTAKNEKEFQVIADAIDGLSEAQFLGVEFERSDKDDMTAKAIAQACDNATQRKQVFEQKLGVKLSVRRFLDANGLPLGFPQARLPGVQRAYGFDGGIGSAASKGASDDLPAVRALAERQEDGSGFGEVTFRSRVTVEYQVENK